MDITLFKILIIELAVSAIILTPIIWLNIKVKKLTSRIKANNIGLRELIRTSREILTLSGEYVDIMHNSLKEKLYNLVVFLGEITSYGIMRRMFRKSYQNYIIGFNIARLFW